MTDRELLKLAAKVAGVELKYDTFGQSENAERVYNYWNPLIDDGEALRLAVKLYMFDGSLFDLFLKFRLEEVLNDSGKSDEEIARRAIVRAAAEIGMNMK